MSARVGFSHRAGVLAMVLAVTAALTLARPVAAQPDTSSDEATLQGAASVKEGTTVWPTLGSVSQPNSHGPLACGGSASAPPGPPSGPTGWSNCGVLGSPGATVSYTWWPHNPVVGVCVLGLGYNNGNQVWHLLGCGIGGTKTVPWGNVGAVPGIRAYTTGCCPNIAKFKH